MTNAQKILFAGMILLAVFWGNRFNNGERASGVSTNNPAEFSALESSSFFAQSTAAVEPGDNARGPSDAASSSEDVLRTQTAGSSADAPGQPAASQPETGAPGGLRLEAGLLGPTAAQTMPVFYRFKNDPPPDIGAQEALVADLQAGETYFEINGDGRWPMASLSKLMTAVLASESMDLKSRITLAPADFSAGEETDFFKTGLAYSANDVLTAMLLLSKNEAAEALADNFGREKFINEMNGTAAAWGMNNTYFADPTGLSIANQSTPQDLEKLALHVYQNEPKIFETTRRKSAAITELDSGKKKIISNINNFAGRSDFLGGKTGYTDEANGNLLSIFSYGRRQILVIVLGTDDRFGDTEKLLNWFKTDFRASR